MQRVSVIVSAALVCEEPGTMNSIVQRQLTQVL
jgi:hypothetical protein